MSRDDQDAVEHARRFLGALRLTPEQDAELELTPQRVTSLMDELFWGLRQAPPTLSVFEPSTSSAEPVIVSALPFRSMCVHHLLPFFGTIDVAYEPDAHLVGFGSIGRVIDHFAARPQMQERLVQQILDYLALHLRPKGLLVRCRARQLCMEYRGACKHGELVSVASMGSLGQGPRREEALREFSLAQRPL